MKRSCRSGQSFCCAWWFRRWRSASINRAEVGADLLPRRRLRMPARLRIRPRPLTEARRRTLRRRRTAQPAIPRRLVTRRRPAARRQRDTLRRRATRRLLGAPAQPAIPRPRAAPTRLAVGRLPPVIRRERRAAPIRRPGAITRRPREAVWAAVLLRAGRSL